MTLPRDVVWWDDDALYELEERVAMRLENVRRPLTRAEEAEVRRWAEECVRRAHRQVRT